MPLRRVFRVLLSPFGLLEPDRRSRCLRCTVRLFFLDSARPSVRLPYPVSCMICARQVVPHVVFYYQEDTRESATYVCTSTWSFSLMRFCSVAKYSNPNNTAALRRPYALFQN